MTRKFAISETDPLPERKPPPGGWRKPDCTFESHKWGIEIDTGRVSVVCYDPCDLDLLDMSGGTPACAFIQEIEIEDFVSFGPIPVKLVYVDDSIPSTPAGPAEYGFYIEVHPA